MQGNTASLLDFAELYDVSFTGFCAAGLNFNAPAIALGCPPAEDGSCPCCTCPYLYTGGAVAIDNGFPSSPAAVIGAAGGPRFDVFGIDVMLFTDNPDWFAGACSPHNPWTFEGASVVIVGGCCWCAHSRD